MDSLSLHRERAAKMDDALSRPAWEFMAFRNPDLPGEPECLLINLPGLGWSLNPPANLRQGSGLTLEQLQALLKTERGRNPHILIRTTPMVFEYLRDWYLMRG